MNKKIIRTSSCPRCRMLVGLCLCSSMPQLDLQTKVVVFMHQKEYSLLTNTGVLAHRVLKNSQIVFRGHRSRIVVQRKDFLEGQDDRNTFILFPSGGARELNEEFMKARSGPLTLICPDGHWGQAKKTVRNEPSLKDLPCVKLPPGTASEYRLRRNQVPGNVCTFEAIARALGQIEGSSIQSQMESVFNKMVTRLLWIQGKISEDEVVW